MSSDLLLLLAVAALVAAGTGLAVWRRARRQRRDAAAYAANTLRQLHIPQSLHPVIDTDICIGSLSCIKACPEGDILGVIDGAARLVHATNCIGHGRCQAECPVGAIRLVFGTSERGVDLPEVDERFESSRPGVHVVGELGGMGLIRNAVTQGTECAEYLAEELGTGSRGGLDVAVIGAGPAGLATALGCRAAGLSVRVLEQSRLGGTVAHFPRQKVVMTETVQLPLYGEFGRPLMSKEELVAAFEKMVTKGKIDLEEGSKVTAIEGGDGDFVLRSTGGELRARKVVLAVGRRGTPRRLGVPGEDLPKVSYSLVDPEQYQGTRVLVVGGGDSAIEAAVQIAKESDAVVALSYRGPELGRCRPRNKEAIEQLAASGRVTMLLGSEVRTVEARQVHLEQAGRPVVLDNDFVIVSIGGELPLELLKTFGVSVRRVFGESVGRHAHLGEARAAVEARRRRRLTQVLAGVGVAILAGLAFMGWDYYWLTGEARVASPLHATLRPAGNWGHGVGIVATAFMLSNFLYAVRKRWLRLKGTGTIRTWLTFHMFVGFMSPLVIAFHTAFQGNNGLAVLTYGSLLIVVGTGSIGRYIYGLVPGSGGRSSELADLLAQRERLLDALEPIIAAAPEPGRIRQLVDRVTAEPRTKSLLLALLGHPLEAARVRFRLAALLRAIPAATRAEFHDDILRLSRLRLEIRFYRGLKRLLSGWRALHAGLAVLLVIVIAGHIGLSLYLGYGWILF